MCAAQRALDLPVTPPLPQLYLHAWCICKLTPVKECKLGVYALQRKAEWLDLLVRMLIRLPGLGCSKYRPDLLNACLKFAVGILNSDWPGCPAFAEQVGHSHAHK